MFHYIYKTLLLIIIKNKKNFNVFFIFIKFFIKIILIIKFLPSSKIKKKLHYQKILTTILEKPKNVRTTIEISFLQNAFRQINFI